MLSIREYAPGDLEEILGLFYGTVHSVNAKDYSPEELDAWAGGNEDSEKWNMSLLSHLSLVAEFEGNIVGFGDIAPDGYLDRLYVRGDFQSRGGGHGALPRARAAFRLRQDIRACLYYRAFLF